MLPGITEPLGVGRIVITPGRADEGDVVPNIVHAASGLGLKVSVLPRVLQVVGSSIEFDDVRSTSLCSRFVPLV